MRIILENHQHDFGERCASIGEMMRIIWVDDAGQCVL